MAYDEETLEPLHGLTEEGEREYERMLEEKEAEYMKIHPFKHALNVIVGIFRKNLNEC